MIKRRSSKIFFGWWTVMAGSIITYWSHGYYFYGLSALFKPISSELGFSRAMTSVAASIGRLEGGLEAPVTGWITDRFGPKWVILAGVFLIGLGFILMYFVNSLWAYFVVWGLITATGVNIGTSLPFEKALSNWFVRKRGLAISVRWAIAGLCVATVLPLVAWLITIVGWRWTCVIGGVVMWLIGFPLAWFFVKQHRPEYYGLMPDGVTVEEQTSSDEMIDRGVAYAAGVEEVEFTLRQAMRTPAYWLLIASAGAQGFLPTFMIIHSIPFLTDRGFDPVKASLIIGVISLGSIVTRFLIGFVVDRIKRNRLRFLVGVSYFVQAIGLITFVLYPTITMLYVLFILYYAAFGILLPLGSIVRARYFGRKAFGSIQGSSMTILTPFAVVSPIFAGWVYDTTGSYMRVFPVLAGLVTLATILVCLAVPPKPPARLSGVTNIL